MLNFLIISSIIFCVWPKNWQLSFQEHPTIPSMEGIINLPHDIFFLLVFISFFVIIINGLILYSFDIDKYNPKFVYITKTINNKFLGYFLFLYFYNLFSRLTCSLTFFFFFICLSCMLMLYKVFKKSFNRCISELKQHSNGKAFLILTELKMKIPFFMLGFYFHPYIFYIMFFFIYAYCIIDFFINKSLCDSGSVAETITIGPETESTSWGKVGVITALVVGVILGGYFYYKHGAVVTTDKMAVVKPDVPAVSEVGPVTNEKVGEVQTFCKQLKVQTPSQLKVPAMFSRDFLPTEFAFKVHYEVSKDSALPFVDLKPMLKILHEFQVPLDLFKDVLNHVYLYRERTYDIILERKVFDYDDRSKQMVEVCTNSFTFSTAKGSYVLYDNKTYTDENHQQQTITIATSYKGSGQPINIIEIKRNADNTVGYIKTCENEKTTILSMSEPADINSSQSSWEVEKNLFNKSIRSVFFPKIPEADPKYEWLGPNKICALTVAENFEVIDNGFAPYSHNDLVYNTKLFYKLVPANNEYFKTLPNLYRDFVHGKFTHDEVINAVYSARSKTYMELFPKGYPHPRPPL
jgi:hypothetical protein